MDFQPVRPAPRPNLAPPNFKPASDFAPAPAPVSIPVAMPDSVPVQAPAPAAPVAVAQTAPAAKPKISRREKFVWPILFGLIALVVAGGSYYWQHKKVSTLSNQVSSLSSQNTTSKALLTDQQNAVAALPNTVLLTTNASEDLAVFLGSNNTGCYKQASNGKGWYQVNKEVNDQFAEIQYGCEKTYDPADPARELVVKTGSQWKIINPVSEWIAVSGVTYPVCGMINDNKVSKLLEPKCVVQTTINKLPQTTVQDVTNP